MIRWAKPSMIGTILHDRWRILSELGRGGMGEVYLAEHIALRRKEALKILKGSLAIDPTFVSRFRREARAVNRLRHPNIIAVYDFGQLNDNRFYLSMEYADGISVYSALRDAGQFSVPRALHVLGQLAYALHHAHSRGVVHRDLKPDNLILVGEDEILKVLDFGVAKIVASDHAESMALSNTNLVWGSPRYMSPERVRGVGDDPRSDIYAIGVMGFELVTGIPPFEGTSDEVIRAHLKKEPEAPSLWRSGSGMPAELDTLILRCMAKNPDDRYQNSADLFAALNKVPGYPAARSEGRRPFVAPRRRPTGETGYSNLRGALRKLAEALIEREAHTQLVVAVDTLRDHETTLAGLEAAQEALEKQVTVVRDTSDDDDSLSSLEHNITTVAELRTAALDKLIAAYDALERLVDVILPAYSGDPAIDPLAQRLKLVKRKSPTKPDP